VARILYIRIDVARKEAGSKTRLYNDGNGTKSYVREKPAVAGDAADGHLRLVAADIGRRGPVPGYAKGCVIGDYVAGNANCDGYRHQKRQKHIVHIAGAVFERINNCYRAVNIVA
jgi:hypothetical protein